MATNHTSAARVYVVLHGNLDEHPEEVATLGAFHNLDAALAFRNADYNANRDVIDDEDDMAGGPDTNSLYIDDGARFWSIEETNLG